MRYCEYLSFKDWESGNLQLVDTALREIGKYLEKHQHGRMIGTFVLQHGHVRHASEGLSSPELRQLRSEHWYEIRPRPDERYVYIYKWKGFLQRRALEYPKIRPEDLKIQLFLTFFTWVFLKTGLPQTSGCSLVFLKHCLHFRWFWGVQSRKFSMFFSWFFFQCSGLFPADSPGFGIGSCPALHLQWRRGFRRWSPVFQQRGTEWTTTVEDQLLVLHQSEEGGYII